MAFNFSAALVTENRLTFQPKKVLDRQRIEPNRCAWCDRYI